METIWQTLSGIAVIIDDKLDSQDTDEIKDIVKQLDSENVPLLKYTAIPSEETISNFKNIAFFILDWNLIDPLTDEYKQNGVQGPTCYDENIRFLKFIKKKNFSPIFIISNESKSSIETKLKEHNLIEENKPPFVFVETKTNLKDSGKLKAKLIEWIKNSPPIYVLKKFESEYAEAKNKTFSLFYNCSANWPHILLSTAKEDSTNPTKEILKIVLRGIESKISPFFLTEELLSIQKNKDVSKKEIQQIIEGQIYITAKYLHGDMDAGDIYKDKDDYYINIRPSCNLIPRNKTVTENIELYLLKGKLITEKALRRCIQTHPKFLIEREQGLISESIIYFIDNGKVVRFLFKDMYIKKNSDMSHVHIGRLLPPFITQLQIKYSSYLSRQGLPRLPQNAFI